MTSLLYAFFAALGNVIGGAAAVSMAAMRAMSACICATSRCCVILNSARSNSPNGRICPIFLAVRAAWPADKPMSVRVSAIDWKEGGQTIEDTIAVLYSDKVVISNGIRMIYLSRGEAVRLASVVFKSFPLDALGEGA